MATDNAVADAHLSWYSVPSKSIGLVVVEASGVDPEGTILPNQIGVWDDKFVPGLKKLAETIHGNDAKAIIQLVHGGARSWRESFQNAERMSPSNVRLMAGPPPREMGDADMQSVIEKFVEVARRAKTASFDGIEIHAAHYYLFSQFLSPLTNVRTDRWGGAIENRARFLVDAVRETRKTVGPEFIISCRLHAVEFIEGGMTADDSQKIAKMLEDAGADMINASAIGSGSWDMVDGQRCLSTTSVPPSGGEPGIYVPYAAKLKAACGLPVAAVGRLAEPGAAEVALYQGLDLVAIARQIIADPLAPQNLLEGRQSEIKPCKSCLNCFKAIREGVIKCPVA
jgi:2,4-dienoyl-CoA reductase-like NADH-dependent reductase (Old Yellow Enzyme family)